MKTLYLDCGMGAAGDMLAAALLELQDEPEAALKKLNRVFDGRAELFAQKKKSCGISGTHLTVTVGSEVEGEEIHSPEEDAAAEHGHGHKHGHAHGYGHAHTSLAEVRAFIGGLDLPGPVLCDALAVYDLLAEAEAKVHDSPVENIHFHEVGTLDAMADVVSVCALLHALKPEAILASPVHVGSGTVHCVHGELPVPAPAAQELLKGIPIYGGEIRGELCTPTGAALLKHFVRDFGALPLMRVEKVGFGLGSKEFPRANGLRALLGETDNRPEQILELSCNLDDMTAEELAFAQERLFQEGALDVFFTHIGMKKSRPGTMLTCLCRPEQREALLRCMFRHTASLGVRETVCARYELKREILTVQTALGPVRVKTAEGFGTSRWKAEYEDLKHIALEQDLSLREAASAAAQEKTAARQTPQKQDS